MKVPVDSLMKPLGEIAASKEASVNRRGAWRQISENVLGYLKEFAEGVKDHPSVKDARIYVERKTDDGEPLVSLRFGNERVPLRRGDRHGIQLGASIHFAATLSGHVRVSAIGFWIECDRKVIGPNPTETVLGTFIPDELAGVDPVRELVERFLAIAAETHWSRSNEIEA